MVEKACPKCSGPMIRSSEQAKYKRWHCRPCLAAKTRKNKARHGGAAAYRNKWKAGNREKYLAWKAVEWALVKGRLVRQPCERCGESKAHAHHDDYSKQLTVMWLCPLHHKERHRELDAIRSEGNSERVVSRRAA